MKKTPFLLSVKYENSRYFWALWRGGSRCRIEDACYACGFARGFESALRAARAAKGVGRRHVELLPRERAHAVYAFHFMNGEYFTGRLPWCAEDATYVGRYERQEDAKLRAAVIKAKEVAEEEARVQQEERARRHRERVERERERVRYRRSQIESGVHWSNQLGLPFPTTLEAVKTAFRSLVKRVHPDQGGTAREFINVSAAYSEALRELQGA